MGRGEPRGRGLRVSKVRNSFFGVSDFLKKKFIWPLPCGDQPAIMREKLSHVIIYFTVTSVSMATSREEEINVKKAVCNCRQLRMPGCDDLR